MKHIVSFLFLALFFLSCQSQNPTENSNQDQMNDPGRLFLGASWTLLYDNTQGSPIFAGESSGWISFNYNASVATYDLKFELQRDLIPCVGCDTYDEVNVQVKNPNQQIIFNQNFELPTSELYTFQISLNNPENGGTHQVIINVPIDFSEFLWAKIYTKAATYRDIKHQ